MPNDWLRKFSIFTLNYQKLKENVHNFSKKFHLSKRFCQDFALVFYRFPKNVLVPNMSVCQGKLTKNKLRASTAIRETRYLRNFLHTICTQITHLYKLAISSNLIPSPHIVWKQLKMSHTIFFLFWHFPPLKLICPVILFDRKLQVFKNSPKWTNFGIFN